jgi:hypothetical protein
VPDTWKENMSDNKTPLQYRINLISLNGELMLSTNWTDKREVVIYIADVVNDKLKHKFRAAVETKATGYVDIGNGINLRSK